MYTLLPPRIYIFNPSNHHAFLNSNQNFISPKLSFSLTEEWIHSYAKHHVLSKPRSYDAHRRQCDSNSSNRHIETSVSPHEHVLKFLAGSLPIVLVCLFIFIGGRRNETAMAALSNSGSFEERSKGKRFNQGRNTVLELKKLVKEKMSKGQMKEAVRYVERLMVIQPGEIEWKLLEGTCYEMMGDIYTAKRIFREILKEYPLCMGALHGLAMVMHKAHQSSAVIKMLEKAVDVARESECVSEERTIRILIAHMLVIQGNVEDGLRTCDILVDENPEDYRPYLLRGIIHGTLERKKEAEEQLAIYGRLVPKDLPKNGLIEEALLAAKANTTKKSKKKIQK